MNSRLDIEVVILLFDFFLPQNMQFNKVVVLVLAPVSYYYTLFQDKHKSSLNTQSFIALCNFKYSKFLKVFLEI